jgi:IS605 OrfB family transposase
MENISTTISIETRISKALVPLLDEPLHALASQFQRAKISMVAAKNNGKSCHKTPFSKEFGLSSRQFNSLKNEVDSLFDSQTSNLQRYIVEAEQELKQAKIRLKTIKKKCEDDKTGLATLTEKQKFKLHNAKNKCHRKIDIIPKKILGWEKLLSDQKIKVCFGSRDLFKQQHQLEANGYATHDQWLDDFRAARSDEFFYLGTKSESNGNQICQLTQDENGEYSLKVRILNGLEVQFGKYIVINNVNFQYKTDQIDKALQANNLRKELSKDLPALLPRHQANILAMKQRQAGTIERLMERGASEKEVTECIAKQSKALAKFQKETPDNLLTDFGQAMTYRFKRDSKGWRVIISISSDNEVEYTTSKKNGAIGVDLNEHHISYVQINSRGNKVACDDIYFRDESYGDCSKQVTTGLGEAVKVLIEQAKAAGCPIVVERLDFKKAKSQIKSGKDKKYNQTVSSLVTAKFLSILTLRCAENAIELFKENPAYTSLIGRLKYANQFSNNIHQAAAMVIARRGAGFSDRKLPRFTMCVVLNKPRYFRTPEDDGKKTIWDQLKLVKQQYDTWFMQTLDRLRAARKVCTPSIDLELDVPF